MSIRYHAFTQVVNCPYRTTAGHAYHHLQLFHNASFASWVERETVLVVAGLRIGRGT